MPVTLPSVGVGSDVGGVTDYGVDLSAAACCEQDESMRTGVEMTGPRVPGSAVVAAVLTVVILALGLSGCAQSNTPSEYGTVTEQNFLELCTNRYYENTDDTLAITDNTIAADVEAPTPAQCECQYDVYVAQMPISDFTTLNNKLKENPQEAWDAVPSSITTALMSCMNSSGSSTTTTVAGTATTQPAVDPSSTTVTP